MEQLPTTIDNLIELPVPSDPQLSPDGQWVVYALSKPDWEENTFVRQLYLVATDTKSEPRQLTFTKNGNTSPRWSPDGQFIAFLSERNDDKHTQIYRLHIAGGEAERLTDFKSDIQSFKWSPDGNSIAFTATPPESEKDKEREKTYGDYVEDNVDYKRAQLWLFDVSEKKTRQLTVDDALHVNAFEWHPDSVQFAISASPSPDMGVRLDMRIYLLDSATLNIHPITAKNTGAPRWSPNGEFLCYEAGVYESLEGAYYKNEHLEIITLADESIQRIPMDFDENPSLIKWADEGIYFLAIQPTSFRLYRVNPDNGAVSEVTPSEHDSLVGMGFMINNEATQSAFVFTDPDRYPEIAVLDFASAEIKLLTNHDQLTREWDIAQHEVYKWTSADGTEIDGIVTKPVDFDPNKKYPLLVVIHGGPQGISLPMRLAGIERRIYPMQQWVAQGAIILQPNYRGSAGHGEAFRSLNVRDLGTGDYADVISGVDALINEGFVDADNVGSMGWSQGGYISAFITTYSDRFKAVSVGAGISNWMTYYVNTDVHPFTINYLQATPWDDPEIYAKTSPMTYIKNAQTPTLIQHGEKDARVPLPNAFELNQGLLDQGVESKLVVYPNMGHGPNKPKQIRHIMNDNFKWFNRHIFGIEDTSDDAQPLYIALASTDEKQTIVEDVYHLARRDSAHFRVLTATGQLSEDQNEASADITFDDYNASVTALSEQITTLNTNKIIFFSGKIDDNRSALTVLGCLQIIAGQSDKLSIEHRAGDVS